jgi:hypothetical protein
VVVEADTLEVLLTDIDPDIDGLRVDVTGCDNDLEAVIEGIVSVGFTDGDILALYDSEGVLLFNGLSVV